MLFGYARVSTADQNPDHQIDALERAGVARDDIYVDHAIELEFKPGKYAVVCFIQDREGGKPHVAQGMIDELTIE